MKILHILNEFGELGNGIVNVAADLACLQAELGHDVVVASGGGSYEPLLVRFGGRHVRIDQTRHPLAIVRAAERYVRLIRAFQPDVVHAHMMTGAVLAWALRRSGHYRLVTTVHNEYQRSAVLMGLGDRVVAVSEAVGHAMRRRGIPGNRIRVVRNGTIGSPRRTPLPEVSPAELRRPAIVTVGAVSVRKGSLDLIRAFAEVAPYVPEAHLYFVGNRDLPEAEQLAEQSGYGERIHFVGFEPQPQRYLLAADVFVLPSHHDPFPLVLLEAREAGLPIVASAVDGIPEALNYGQSGVLVPPREPQALADALLTLLRLPEERFRLAVAARQGLAYYSARRMTEEYLAIYHEVQGMSSA